MDPAKLIGRVTKDTAVDAAAQAEFSEKKRVWVPDTAEGFLPGWIKSEPTPGGDTAEVVITTTGEIRVVPVDSLSPMNPPQFDGVEDIAELTHLNEASVVNDLRMRYGAGSIYTYSGLFLISLNPYRPLPIYTPKVVSQYRSKRREENPPHIFAIAERAWQQIGEERESQSILITGESGAGKTENTKKVIQYLAAIATAADAASASAPSGLPRSASFKSRDIEDVEAGASAELGLLERQILQANPILEAFGNAQTMRNNNSSRFGKFIRIFLAPNGSIAGANIDWYLLEKSRVTTRAQGERSFHVFYQLLQGAKESGLAEPLLLEGGAEKYKVLNQTRLLLDGVDDLSEWRSLKAALDVVGFSKEEQFELFRVVAAILHIGNLELVGGSTDQAYLSPESQSTAEKVCHLLGISVKEFVKSVLTPKVRAGRELVTHARTKKQAEDELAALSKFMFEKAFSGMVDRINTALDRPSSKSLFIGVLDIAGFEIFDVNSYEQLLINFTNEKLQQFFNFHMFTLEQEEYTREGIKWDYVNFGLDLQPTIELIESTQPIGVLSLLDEECIMPKATDVTFTDKVQEIWEPPKGSSKAVHPGSAKYKATRFSKGFVIRHYAGDVEYRTEGWLSKNKDPVNDAVAGLLSQSDVPAITTMFAEYAEDANANVAGKRKKRGAFRTLGQRHKEQLNQLMGQLAATQPHFVRCIVPNADKKPGRVDVNLVLDQLRCNGVLEGIRIARLGFPNRHSFAEFRQRYEVLTPGVVPQGFMDGRKAAALIAQALELDSEFYAIGATKIFFKAGILAELEERRDALLTDLFRRFQAAARMHIHRRRINKLINRAQAVRTIQRNARAYIELRDWPWWSLYAKVRPLLAATRVDDELARKQAELSMAKERAERDEQEKKRLEELRAALLSEKEKVERDLSAERDLAVEKDQMLNRSKANESDLQERVKELEEELAKLETKYQDAVSAAEQNDDNLAKLRHKHDQLAEQVRMLEKDNVAARQREMDLLRQSKDKSAEHSKLENAKSEVARQLEQLRSDVANKEEQQRRAKEKKEAELVDVQRLLQEERKKTETSTARAADLSKDVGRREAALQELRETIKGHEATISAKQTALVELEGKRATSAKAHEASEAAKAALQVTIDGLKSEFSQKDKERQTLVGEKAKLEKSLDELRKVMDAKVSEEIKRKEVDRSREAENSDLRKQVSQLQELQEKQRENAAQLANKLRVDIDGLRQRHSAAERDLASTKEALKSKESLLTRTLAASTDAEKARKQAETERRNVQSQLKSTEEERDAAKAKILSLQQESQEKDLMFAELEDALLPLEHERDAFRKQLEATKSQLSTETARRQKVEQQLCGLQEELAQNRNELEELERDLTSAAGDIKARDDEVALLRSRENRTIVEHVHVLESAKKVTDRQLANQVEENMRLNQTLKSMETKHNRLQGDYDDLQHLHNQLKRSHNKEARVARASLGPEDKATTQLLAEERKARALAESKIASLERDLAEQRRRASAANLTPKPRSVSSSAEGKLARALEEISRLEKAQEVAAADNKRLAAEVAAAQRAPVPPPKAPNFRAELLRGLQQSHEALGRDMSETLRRFDSAPLTPSRRHNSGSGPVPGSPSKEDAYSQMRLKAKSVGAQLDNWLATEGRSGSHGPKLGAVADEVQRLRQLLSQLDS
ncbi:class II myosin [Vanrija albida]|uniref:Class II myosin n=1 Tax=Vanrija albida TaxID=181172 RepID=A0ABR3PVB1_9TREE